MNEKNLNFLIPNSVDELKDILLRNTYASSQYFDKGQDPFLHYCLYKEQFEMLEYCSHSSFEEEVYCYRIKDRITNKYLQFEVITGYQIQDEISVYSILGSIKDPIYTGVWFTLEEV